MEKNLITVQNKLGLHARAAAKLVSLASKYRCDIFIQRDDRKVNGKSIMGVMMLAASHGTQLNITAEGEDQQAAMTAICDLINNKFGEKE